MRKNLLILLFSVSLSGTLAQQQPFDMHYHLDVEYKRVEIGEVITSEGMPNPIHEDICISLYANGAFNTEGKFFDIKQERIIHYSQDTIYTILPLYSYIDNSRAEFDNRVYLSEMLEKAGQKNVMGTMLQLESLFGIENTKLGIRKAITTKMDNDTVVFLANKKEIARIHYSENKMPQAYSDAFAQFITYEIALHPSIKEKILKANFIPDVMRFQYYNVGKEITKIYKYNPLSKQASSITPTDISKYHIIKRPTNEIEGLIDSVYYVTLIQSPNVLSTEDYLKKIKQYIDEGNNLSAILCGFEYRLSMPDNEDINGLLQQIVAKKNKDVLIKRFLDCLDAPTTKQEAEKKVNEFEKLIQLNKDYGYVMNIFIANYLKPIDNKLAKPYFFKALQANPNITGVWSDLGETYAEEFQHVEAWKCYEIMLKINPEHDMSKKIKSQKNSLLGLLPSYLKNK